MDGEEGGDQLGISIRQIVKPLAVRHVIPINPVDGWPFPKRRIQESSQDLKLPFRRSSSNRCRIFYHTEAIIADSDLPNFSKLPTRRQRRVQSCSDIYSTGGHSSGHSIFNICGTLARFSRKPHHKAAIAALPRARASPE